MTEQEVFDNVCVKYKLGQRLDIENYPHVPAAPGYAHTRKVAQELIDSARAMFPKLLPIHFDFVNDGSVNAWALRDKDRYFIGLTAGAMCMLHLILDRMLASPCTFPNIGQPKAEDPNLPPVPWHIPDAERLFHSGIRPILPKCDARMLYANHLADQALMFLVGHEIAHITRGHVDYLASTSGNAFLAELGWQGNSQGRLERQVIEADADRRSVLARCYSMMNTALHVGDKFPHWATSPLPAEAWQFDWAFAVNTLFRLFGDARFSGIDLNAQPYPPLPLRRRMAMDTAYSLLIQAWGEERQHDAQNVLVSAVKATESSFSAVGADSSEGGLQESDTTAAREHIDRISEYWNELCMRLKPYSYEQLGGD